MTAKMLTWGIFAATRAQYGLLRPILTAMERSRTLTPRLIMSPPLALIVHVTGGRLTMRGGTWCVGVCVVTERLSGGSEHG